MKSEFHQGYYRPLNPKKYKGTTPIIYRSYPELMLFRKFDTSPNVVEWSSESTVIPYIKPTDGKVHRYFVDFKILFEYTGMRQTYLIEYKPYKKLIPPVKGRKRAKTILYETAEYAINQAKFEAAEKYADRKSVV